MKFARPRMSLALFAAATLSVVGPLSIGCQSGPKVQKSFDQPRLPNVPPRVAMPIDDALQRRALDQITAAYESGRPEMKAQAFEAMARTEDPNAAGRVLAALDDGDWLVRFAAAMCAGDLKIASARPSLLRRVDDQNPNVRAAVRYALHLLGDKSRTRELEALSQSSDPRVRANVALCIGLLGEPTGVRVVRPMLSDPVDSVCLAACEALWALGDEQGLKSLVAGTISKFVDEQIVCTLALARPRNPVVKDYIIGKLAIDKDNEQYIELQLAAARALGMLGDDAGFGVAIEAAKSRDSRQRGLAAFAMGAIRRSDAQPPLAKLLDDSDPGVRLAAAMAIRQLPLPQTAP